MGTRSLITFIDEYNVTDKKTNQSKLKRDKIVTIYQQYDGNPENVGLELANFLKNGEVVNGIPIGKSGTFFNGVGCMAAQFIAEFKTSCGGLYLYKPGITNVWEEYRYNVVVFNGMVTIECFEVNGKKATKIFQGNAIDFIKKYDVTRDNYPL